MARMPQARPMRAIVVLALSACIGPAVSPSQPSPTPSSATTLSPAASPTATAPRPQLTVVGLGAIPSRFRYAVLGWEPVTRVWLVDLHAREKPRLVIRLEHMGNGELTASSDGQVIVLSASGAVGARAVHVVRPTTGAHFTVYDDADAQVGGTPIVTRAGDRYAFAKQLAGVTGFAGGRTDLGLWIGGTDGSTPRRVIAGGGSAASIPVEWSPDGRWLAFTRGPEVFLLAPDGSERRAGTGVGATWLSNTTLLIARDVSAPPGIDRYDLDTGVLREELRATARVTTILADPTGRRYAYVVRNGTEDLLTPGTVWLREATGGAARSLGAHRMRAFEWSSDGVALTGIVGGDDSITGVEDLLGGPGAGLCTRSEGLPQASPSPDGCV